MFCYLIVNSNVIWKWSFKDGMVIFGNEYASPVSQIEIVQITSVPISKSQVKWKWNTSSNDSVAKKKWSNRLVFMFSHWDCFIMRLKWSYLRKPLANLKQAFILYSLDTSFRSNIKALTIYNIAKIKMTKKQSVCHEISNIT